MDMGNALLFISLFVAALYGKPNVMRNVLTCFAAQNVAARSPVFVMVKIPTLIDM